MTPASTRLFHAWCSVTVNLTGVFEIPRPTGQADDPIPTCGRTGSSHLFQMHVFHRNSAYRWLRPPIGDQSDCCPWCRATTELLHYSRHFTLIRLLGGRRPQRAGTVRFWRTRGRLPICPDLPYPAVEAHRQHSPRTFTVSLIVASTNIATDRA